MSEPTKNAAAEAPPAAGMSLEAWVATRVPAYCCDREGRIHEANDAFRQLFTRAGEAADSLRLSDLVHPADLAAAPPAGAESRLRSPLLQRWRTVGTGWQWFSWERAETRGLIRAVGRNVNRQRLAEELYHQLARAVDQSSVGIAITDLGGRVQYVNPRFVEMVGRGLEEMLDGNMDVLRDGHESEESYQRFWASISAGRDWSGEFCRRKPDGRVVWEVVRVCCVRDSLGQVASLLSLREDGTERRTLEAQLRQAQKMESIGTLAGGIAHDFNNLLAVISGYSELCLLQPENPTLQQRGLREIGRAATAAIGVVKKIMTFSRKTQAEMVPVDLNQLARDLVSLMADTFPRAIRLDFSPDAGLPRLQADQNQLQQVIMNLCVNARDALPSGGVISLRTSVVPGARIERHKMADPAINYACLEVSDNGTGIPAEVIDRIFEPFFTTKGLNEGTGLGLAVVYGIITGHSGFIHVDSTPGVGSTFRMYFPIGALSPEAPKGEEPGDFPGGPEKLLIVDDEDALRRLLQTAFTQKGYQVQGASNGLEAVDIVMNPDREFDAVILDMNMPGANGLAVLRVLKERRPKAVALVLAGNVSPSERAEIARLGYANIMGKPFSLKDLGRRVRTLLDAGQ